MLLQERCEQKPGRLTGDEADKLEQLTSKIVIPGYLSKSFKLLLQIVTDGTWLTVPECVSCAVGFGVKFQQLLLTIAISLKSFPRGGELVLQFFLTSWCIVKS